MSKAVKIALAVGMLMAALAPAAFAQREQLRFSVPFDFSVGGKVLPAGSYVLTRSTLLDPTLLTIRNPEARQAAFITGAALDSSQEGAQVVFHQYQGRYFLAEIWTDSGHRTLPESKMARALAKAPPTVITTGGQ